MKCNRNRSDFSECLRKAIESAVNGLTEPMRELGLPSLEPLELPEFSVAGATTGSIQLSQIYKNVKIFGFSKIRVQKAE